MAQTETPIVANVADASAILAREAGLHRNLTPRQLSMIAVGGAIGTGLFLGSALSVNLAGPGVILSYTAAAGIALALMWALGEMAIGDAKAPITVIEYASMTCPHCAHFSATTFPELKKRYIDTGKVRFMFREFPLDQLAAAGFILARCAGPDKYFPLVETLFAQQKDWVVQKPLQPLLAIAKQAGLSQEAFEACLDNRQLIEGMEKVRNQASEKFGVNSTPTFFVNGKRLSGALSIEEMEKEFAPYL